MKLLKIGRFLISDCHSSLRRLCVVSAFLCVSLRLCGGKVVESLNRRDAEKRREGAEKKVKDGTPR
jgi:hypothetical protein